MQGAGAGFVQNEAIDESELQSEAKQNHSEHEVSIAIHGHSRNSGCESSVGRAKRRWPAELSSQVKPNRLMSLLLRNRKGLGVREGNRDSSMKLGFVGLEILENFDVSGCCTCIDSACDVSSWFI